MADLADHGADLPTLRSMYEAWRSGATKSELEPGDHVVVATGCNGLHILEVALAWPGALHRRRRGPDGADLELLEAADFAAASGRYERVVIGSGDRIFMLALENLRSNSIDVDVVAPVDRRPLGKTNRSGRALGHRSSDPGDER